jgi:hypothetical protein
MLDPVTLIYWDYDGTFVPNIAKKKLHGIKINELSTVEFAEQTQKYYSQINKNAREFFKLIFGIYSNSILYNILVSGRLQSLAEKNTFDQLRDALIFGAFEKFNFYPEDLSHELPIYYDWKEHIVHDDLNIRYDNFHQFTAIVVDDDQELLWDFYDKAEEILPRKEIYLKLLYLESFENESIQAKWLVS